MLMHRLGLARRHFNLQHANLVIFKNDPMVSGCGYDRVKIGRGFSLHRRSEYCYCDHQLQRQFSSTSTMSDTVTIR